MYEVNEICKNGTPLSLNTEGQLRVVFIGTGSAFAKRRRQSNMLIIQGDHHVLIDCGTQGPLALNDVGLSVLKVRCQLPTHSHADHIGGFEEVALMNGIDCIKNLDSGQMPNKDDEAAVYFTRTVKKNSPISAKGEIYLSDYLKVANC